MSSTQQDFSGKNILATAPINDEAVEILSRAAPVVISPSPSPDTLQKLAIDAVAIVGRGEAQIDATLITAAPHLRVIGRSGVGYDNVDVPAATARGIPLVIAPVGGFAVAEGALAMLLALIKQLPRCDSAIKSGQWYQRYDFFPGDMADHTLGIIGLGRIGANLAKLAQPFGMTVLGYDPVVDPAQVADLGVRAVELDELLVHSDYVSVHTPLNEHTRGMINRERVAKMKKGAIFINTARGGVIESLDVLADALESGQLASVGLDVFPTEPPDVSHRIFQHPQLLAAPHLVGGSALAMKRIQESMANDMISVLEGRRPKYCVNPEVFE